MSRETLGYVLAAAGLIGLGIVLRTPILNWISGPAFVVVVVSLVARGRS